MKKILFASLIMLCFAFNASAQTIEGGGGVIALSTGADPNSITAIATQTWATGESVFAVDAHTGTIWRYDDSQAGGSKWQQLATGAEATTVSDGNTIDFTLAGVDITAEVILDVSGENIATSSASGLLVDSPVDGVSDAANGLDVTLDGSELVNVAPDVNELTAETLAGADEFIIYDADGTDHNKVTADDIVGLHSLTLSADSGTNQTLTNGNTVNIATGAGLASVAGATDQVTINRSLASYADDAAATTGGVGAGEEYLVTAANPYGMPVGSIRIRQ